MRHLREVILVTLLTCGTAHIVAAQRRTMPSLSEAVAERIARTPGADVAVSFRDLATGDAFDLRPDVEFHAASTMKLPVMIEVLRAVEQQRLSLDQGILLVNSFPSLVDGSPFSLDAHDDSDSSMYRRIGERVPVRELMERMIVRSSNLATNELIELVGARNADASARALGATRTHVRRGVEDAKAFAAGLNNTTTSSDLAILLMRIERNEAVSAESGRLMKDVLLRQEFNGEIPAGLPAGTPVAHKTGSITATLHDAAIVYPPSRPPYVLVVLTRAIPDEAVARTLIADISRLVWNAVGTTTSVSSQ